MRSAIQISLARDQNLTTYVAAYLDLAMRHGVPLETLNNKRKAAAQAVGVALHGVHQTGTSGTPATRVASSQVAIEVLIRIGISVVALTQSASPTADISLMTIEASRM